jgi:hypothetical protein
MSDRAIEMMIMAEIKIRMICMIRCWRDVDVLSGVFLFLPFVIRHKLAFLIFLECLIDGTLKFFNGDWFRDIAIGAQG